MDKARLDEVGPENLDLLSERLGRLLETPAQEWLWRTALMELSVRMEIRDLLNELWPEYRLGIGVRES